MHTRYPHGLAIRIAKGGEKMRTRRVMTKYKWTAPDLKTECNHYCAKILPLDVPWQEIPVTEIKLLYA